MYEPYRVLRALSLSRPTDDTHQTGIGQIGSVALSSHFDVKPNNFFWSSPESIAVFVSQ